MGDQGSVVSSDNMWDDYQEHYSEHNYSEKEMEYDTVRQLLEFGDDYRSFIGSTSDTSSLSGLRLRGGGSARKTPGGLRQRGRDSELDSEQEHHMCSGKNTEECSTEQMHTSNKMDVETEIAAGEQVQSSAPVRNSTGGPETGPQQVDEVLSESNRALHMATEALKKYLLSKNAMTSDLFVSEKYISIICIL